MREFKKLSLVLAFPFLFTSCEDPGLAGDTKSLYGEKYAADTPYITRLNSYGDSDYENNGTSFSRKLNNRMSGPTQGLMCGSSSQGGYVDQGPDLNSELTLEQLADLDNELGEIPSPGGAVNTELPRIIQGTSIAKRFGYYRYRDGDNITYGTKRTIWRIRAAGRLLAEQKITMGIGDISKNGGGKLSTHSTHRNGQDVDLRLVDKNGNSSACTVQNSSCYDRANTFKMIKALIDVDPKKVKLVYINDPVLRREIDNYYNDTYVASGGARVNIAKSCAGHDNHAHFSWKN